MESKRTAQISPDKFGVGIFAILLVAVVMLASMVFSYVSIAEAGQWSHVPHGMHWLAPVFIDGAILTYTVSLAIFESREEDHRTIRRTRGILWGFTGLSVVVNFAHAASGWQWDFTVLEAWIGCMIAVSAPVAALMSAEEVVRLAFKHRRAVIDSEPIAAEVSASPVMEVAAQMPAGESAADDAEEVASEASITEPVWSELEDDLLSGVSTADVLHPDVQESSAPGEVEAGEHVADPDHLRKQVAAMTDF